MQREPEKYLFDIQQAIGCIREFIAGLEKAEYFNNVLIRSAVERQMMIVGEAVTQLLKIAPQLEPQLTACREIIRFRNILVHGYFAVSNDLVWGILEADLDVLEDEIQRLLDRGF